MLVTMGIDLYIEIDLQGKHVCGKDANHSHDHYHDTDRNENA